MVTEKLHCVRVGARETGQIGEYRCSLPSTCGDRTKPCCPKDSLLFHNRELFQVEGLSSPTEKTEADAGGVLPNPEEGKGIRLETATAPPLLFFERMKRSPNPST
jgi:hypothetical protein